MKVDYYTGETQCQCYGRWFLPDDNRFYGHTLCKECDIEAELKADEALLRR